MLKRLICFALMLSLLGLSGCRKEVACGYELADEPQAEQTPSEENIEQGPLEEEAEPQGVGLDSDAPIELQWSRDGFSTIYRFRNEDSKALIQKLNGYAYEGELCKCMGEYSLQIGDQGANISLWEGYARYGGKQEDLTDEESAAIRAIFKRQLVAENRAEVVNLPVTMVSTPEGKFSFEDERGVRWSELLSSFEYTEEVEAPVEDYSVSINVATYFFRLEGKKPYAINFQYKKAFLNQEQVAAIRQLLAESCLEKDTRITK